MVAADTCMRDQCAAASAHRTSQYAQPVPGRIALVGSGEYLPAMHDVEAWLLEERPPVFVQLATAAAPEGQHSLEYWRQLGADAAHRLGVQQVFVDVRTPADADDPKFVELVRGAGLIYFSGGNPSFLARTLTGSALLDAVIDEWRSGTSLGGCSAGAMAIGGYIPNLRHPRVGGTDGFGIVPDVRVLPHFDRYSSWIPNFAAHLLVSESHHVVGIDEETALVAEPRQDEVWAFRAYGRQSTWLIGTDGPQPINEIELRVAVSARN